MSRTNPHQNARASAEEESRYAFLSTGRVNTAPPDQSGGAHHVVVQESAAPSDEPIPVLPTVPGDYFVPPEGAPVIVSPIGKNDFAVVGTAIPGTVETPNIQPGERIVSHPTSDAKVHFENDGTIRVNSSGTIIIGDGDQGAVTDVEIDSTNSNGGATSLNIVRRNDVLL